MRNSVEIEGYVGAITAKKSKTGLPSLMVLINWKGDRYKNKAGEWVSAEDSFSVNFNGQPAKMAIAHKISVGDKVIVTGQVRTMKPEGQKYPSLLLSMSGITFIDKGIFYEKEYLEDFEDWLGQQSKPERIYGPRSGNKNEDSNAESGPNSQNHDTVFGGEDEIPF